jgi:hypothetical protein
VNDTGGELEQPCSLSASPVTNLMYAIGSLALRLRLASVHAPANARCFQGVVASLAARLRDPLSTRDRMIHRTCTCPGASRMWGVPTRPAPRSSARHVCSYSNHERHNKPRSVADILREQKSARNSNDEEDEFDDDDMSMEPRRQQHADTSHTARRQSRPLHSKRASDTAEARAARPRNRRPQVNQHYDTPKAPKPYGKREAAPAQKRQAYMSPALVELLNTLPQGKELTDRYHSSPSTSRA